MKLLLPLAVCLCLWSGAFGQSPGGWGNPFESPSEQSRPEVLGDPVSITVDIVSVSRADAFALVRLKSAAMWEKVCEMVKTGTAKSEFLGSVTTASDERAIVECILEFRYPTEFALQDTPDFGAPPAKYVHPIFSWIWPLGYDVRNVGIFMEVLPTIQKEGISLQLIPSRTIFKEFTTYPLARERTVLSSDQPIFNTRKIQSKVLVESGKPLFLGAGGIDRTPDGKSADRVVLMFVTATLQNRK